MIALQQLSQIITAGFWILIIPLTAMATYRAYIAIFKMANRQFLWEVSGERYIKWLKILFGLALLLIGIIIPFYVVIASPYVRFVPSYLNMLLLVSIAMFVVVEGYLALSISQQLLAKTYKKVLLTLLVLVFLPLSVYNLMFLPGIFAYPSDAQSYIIDLPVKGTWVAGHAGGSEDVNYHCAHTAQMYAMDICKVDDNGNIYSGAGKEVSDFYTMGENIYAPVGGTIVAVVDSLPNVGIVESPETENPAGNHVVIEFEKERYVFLAHLDQGTIKVKEGELVESGEIVGQAGNSGNTSWPHLHMHIQDKPVIDNDNAVAFPYRFAAIERNRWFSWGEVTNAFLVRNDLFKELN